MSMKLSWFTRNRSVHVSPDTEQKLQAKVRTLCISLLVFSSFEPCEQLVGSLLPMLDNNDLFRDVKIILIIRNNNRYLDSSNFDRFITTCREQYRAIEILLFNDGVNIGFGGGHNLNFGFVKSDYFLILNDDIGFRDLEWLRVAMTIMDENPRVALVGAEQNPSSIAPFFANGEFSRDGKTWPLRYAEGSVLLVRSETFSEVGMFDPQLEWAYFEDSDLSFRTQAHGYQISWIDIPHEHWRSSSFNKLPASVKNAIVESNRATIFAKWNVAIKEGRVGSVTVYDLWSDGIGDVFLALLHLQAYIEDLTAAQAALIVVNTSAPDLARAILAPGVTVESIAEKGDLLEKVGASKVRAYLSIRSLNYGAPGNIHSIVCGCLSIPVADTAKLSALLRSRFVDNAAVPQGVSALRKYCVVHVESERQTHDGRVPSPMTMNQMMQSAASKFEHIVVVGKHKQIDCEIFRQHGRSVTDLQGTLSLPALVGVIARADAFVGIDSFPAHVAQVMGVRSAVFFGSVHPSYRVLSETLTWPIVANLPCIGCYHTSTEPSIPFCMRRDLACTVIDEATVDKTVEACANLDVFDWRPLSGRAMELQRKMFTRVMYHPSASAMSIIDGSSKQDAVSHLISQAVEQIRDVMERSDRKAGQALRKSLDEVRAENFTKDVRIQSMVKLIAELRRR